MIEPIILIIVIKGKIPILLFIRFYLKTRGHSCSTHKVYKIYTERKREKANNKIKFCLIRRH